MAMDSTGHPEHSTITIRLRQLLLELARRQDNLALSEAVDVPYWAPPPTSVTGHRAAAQVLRSEADRLLSAPCGAKG
jgi:hypothetical protein